MIDVMCEPGDLLPIATIECLAESFSSVCRHLSESCDVAIDDVTILIVSHVRICELHDQFFDDPSPTDVITFPAEDSDERRQICGDIAICLDVARDQAGEVGHSVIAEMVFLGIHGLLHLMGWDDRDSDDRARMLQRQSDLMAYAGPMIGSA
ncbi:hypothetical protein BH23CHL2_BH23CHL2_15020 [soil metagenome]